MTSFGRTSEMLDGCELFAFDDGAIRNSDEIQTEFRAEIRNRNSQCSHELCTEKGDAAHEMP